MLQNSFFSDWLKDLPEVLQYVVVIFLALIILYICLLLTRLLGRNRGNGVHYDNPEEYEKQVPDLFGSTAFKRKPKQGDDEGKDGDQRS